MKRTIVLTVTVALFGGLMFMGFAGTATAQDVNINEAIDFGDQETGDSTATSNVDVNQNNDNSQVGVATSIADSESTAIGADDYKNGGAAEAFSNVDSTASVDQTQDVAQSNTADVNVTTESESGDNVQVSIDALLDGLLDGEDGENGVDGDNGNGADGNGDGA